MSVDRKHEKSQSINLHDTLSEFMSVRDPPKDFLILPHVLPVFSVPKEEFICVWYQKTGITSDFSNEVLLRVPKYADYEIYNFFIRVASGNANIDVILATIPNRSSFNEKNQLVSSMGYHHLMLTADQTSFRWENKNPITLPAESYITMDGSFVSGSSNIDASFLIKRRKYS